MSIYKHSVLLGPVRCPSRTALDPNQQKASIQNSGDHKNNSNTPPPTTTSTIHTHTQKNKSIETILVQSFFLASISLANHCYGADATLQHMCGVIEPGTQFKTQNKQEAGVLGLSEVAGRKNAASRLIQQIAGGEAEGEGEPAAAISRSAKKQ